MTLSPRTNNFGMKRSRATGFDFFLPLAFFGNSVHISFTSSRTILQWLKEKSYWHILVSIPQNISTQKKNYRSKALIRPSNFLLLRQLIKTCAWLRTECVRTESGPMLNSSCSLAANSSFKKGIYKQEI